MKKITEQDLITAARTLKEKIYEGEFAADDGRNPDGTTIGDRNSTWQNISRAFKRAPSIVGLGYGAGDHFTDTYGLEGYEFSPDWDKLGYSGKLNQKVRMTKGDWIADDGDATTDPSVSARLSQMALADMKQNGITPRKGWDSKKEQLALAGEKLLGINSNNALAQNNVGSSSGSGIRTGTSPKLPTPPASNTPQAGPKEGDTATSKSGKPIIFQGGKWVYK